MTNNETEKYIRDSIRECGLVFKKSKFNNLYLLTDRKTKEIIISNATLGGTLNNVCSGYLSAYDKDTQSFSKIELAKLGLIWRI